MHAVLFAILSLSASETFTIDRPAVEIVEALQHRMVDVDIHFPPQAAKLLELADIRITADLRPAWHYYRFDAVLESPIQRPILRRLTCSSTTEIWARGDKTIIRTGVSLGGFRCGLAQRILARVEIDVTKQKADIIRCLLTPQPGPAGPLSAARARAVQVTNGDGSASFWGRR